MTRYNDLLESFAEPPPQAKCSEHCAQLRAIICQWIPILLEAVGDRWVPLEGGEHDAESCAGGGRFVAERAAVNEHEHLFLVGVADESIAANTALVYLNGEEFGRRGGRRWGDENPLGVGDGVGNWCGEAEAKHRIKGTHWADWGLGKLGKTHGGKIKMKEMQSQRLSD